MERNKEFLLTIVQRVFSNWTALRMAVEHGMGPKEKAVDFCSYIAEVLCMNEGINSSDIAAELQDYVDEEFNTELQDNSAKEVAQELFRFYRYCAEGNEQLAAAELDKLPPLQLWIQPHNTIRRIRTEPISVNNDSSDSSEEVDGNMEVVADEWTEVKSRRKK